ncbi:MAG: cytochrome c3 family protein [Raoultibacter sp.]
MDEHNASVDGTSSFDEKAEQPNALKRKKRTWIIVGVVAAVVVAAGAGFWIWHEQPSFCSAICHTPMDSYVEKYYSHDPSQLASMHEGADVTCMQCHVPTLSQQISEGTAWLAGGYTLPLEQRRFDDSFCLNGSCHDVDRSHLAARTNTLTYNPHSDYHGEVQCGECHKAHESSKMQCAQCHGGAKVPAGWMIR